LISACQIIQKDQVPIVSGNIFVSSILEKTVFYRKRRLKAPDLAIA